MRERFLFDPDDLFFGFEQRSETRRRLTRLVDVVRCRDRDICMTQEIFRSSQAVFPVHHRAGFFSQFVDRFLRADALLRSQASRRSKTF